VESLPTARVLLLVNYRPEYWNPWTGKTYYTQLHLDPLPPQPAEALLTALMGDSTELLPLKRLLVDRTEGNPFFLEESVRTLVETRVLAGEYGDYHLTKPLPGVNVPPTVQAVLAARIDRLPPEEKQLLQEAAVIGKDVSLALLRVVTELPEEELRQRLNRLQTAEFIHETTLFPGPVYAFKHALTYEVAYGEMLQHRRKRLHRRVLEACEMLFRDRLKDNAASLARHAIQAEVWEKAAEYLYEAGVRAWGLGALDESREHYERALGILSSLPETDENLLRSIDVRMGRIGHLNEPHLRGIDADPREEADPHPVKGVHQRVLLVDQDALAAKVAETVDARSGPKLKTSGMCAGEGDDRLACVHARCEVGAEEHIEVGEASCGAVREERRIVEDPHIGETLCL